MVAHNRFDIIAVRKSEADQRWAEIAIMQQRPMAEIGTGDFGGVEELVHGEVVSPIRPARAGGKFRVSPRLHETALPNAD